jgi:tryptophan synthase alpha chain
MTNPDPGLPGSPDRSARVSARLEGLLEATRGGRRLLMGAVVAGDPHLEATQKYMHVLADAGVDIIEVIVPFSDPTYHGPVIQRASARAIHEEIGWQDICTLVEGFRLRHASVPLVISSYFNRILARGLTGCAAELARVGVDAVMITDVPWEESQAPRKAFAEEGVALIDTLAPTTSFERFQAIAQGARGFLVWTGHSGGELTISDHDFQLAMAQFRQATELPIIASMQISTGDEAARVARFADGILVGSALVWLVEGRGPDMSERLRRYVQDIRASLDQTN